MKWPAHKPSGQTWIHQSERVSTHIAGKPCALQAWYPVEKINFFKLAKCKIVKKVENKLIAQHDKRYIDFIHH